MIRTFWLTLHKLNTQRWIIKYAAALLKTRLLRLNAWSTNKFSLSFRNINFLYIFYYHQVLELPTASSIEEEEKVPECVGIEVVFFCCTEKSRTEIKRLCVCQEWERRRHINTNWMVLSCFLVVEREWERSIRSSKHMLDYFKVCPFISEL